MVRFVGNQGAPTIEARLVAVGSLQFIESTSSGTVNTTSIFPRSIVQADGAKYFLAVHSRHLSLMLGRRVVSQWVRLCRKLQHRSRGAAPARGGCAVMALAPNLCAVRGRPGAWEHFQRPPRGRIGF